MIRIYRSAVEERKRVLYFNNGNVLSSRVAKDKMATLETITRSICDTL